MHYSHGFPCFPARESEMLELSGGFPNEVWKSASDPHPNQTSQKPNQSKQQKHRAWFSMIKLQLASFCPRDQLTAVRIFATTLSVLSG